MVLRLHLRSGETSSAHGAALLATLLLHAGLAGAVLLSRGEETSPRGAMAEPPVIALVNVPQEAPPAATPPQPPQPPPVVLADIPLREPAPPVLAVASAIPPTAILPAAIPPAVTPSAVPPAPIATAPPDAAAAYRKILWQWVAARRPQGLHLEGEAVVVFTLDRSGRILAARIERTSGNKLLDRLALRTVRVAAPFPAPPADLPEGALQFQLAFNFH